VNLNYQDHQPEGAPAVLLLHGLGATCNSWIPQIPALCGAGFRVIAPDLPGFGRSKYSGGGNNPPAMARSVAGLLTELDTGQVHVAGISMGGTVALQLSLDHSHLIRSLVLINTFAVLRPRRITSWLYLGLRFILVHTLGLPVQARAVTRRIFPEPEQTDLRRQFYEQIIQADPHGYRSALRSLARFNLVRRLPEISNPTLVITGANDTTVFPENQKVLAENIPNASQIIIPGGGHAVTVEKTGLINQILLDFWLSDRF
jgi:3-oxoadipate enol-lactonase